jgi:hypothetical protein
VSSLASELNVLLIILQFQLVTVTAGVDVIDMFESAYWAGLATMATDSILPGIADILVDADAAAPTPEVIIGACANRKTGISKINKRIFFIFYS